ncbi:ornithine cyclodeaminase family protein [Micromonosporaceae bacterium B7E4]
MTGPESHEMLLLSRAEVMKAAASIDPVAAVREAVRLHATGRTTLPEEAYLPWEASDGSFARSLALPGALWGDVPAAGLKMINSSLGNPARGLPRAQGLTVLFDLLTAYPVAMLEAAYLSALRTAAFTALSVQLLAVPEVATVAVVGCGALGDAHARVLARVLPPETRFVLCDLDAARRDHLVAELGVDGIAAHPARDAEQAVRGAAIVVTTTTTTHGYLPYEWLAAGALVAHVSLDDVLPDVVTRADLVVVDDWPLVSGDSRRLLGRMYRAKELAGPRGETWDGPAPDARRVDATVSDVLVGAHPGRTSPDQIILSNPFGMGILDVALAAQIVPAARRLGLGTTFRL